MKDSVFEIKSNRQLADGIWHMTLAGDTGAITNPGQFVNIKLDGFFLRRPISVNDCEEGMLAIIYKVLGRGTDVMTTLTAGTKLDILTGLGNGYDLTKAGEKPLLIGGGVGLPPMYWAAKKLTAAGKKPCVVMGFNTEKDIFFKDEFLALGCEVRIATADGSEGTKGFVTDALPEDYSYFYACGPTPMLKAVYTKTVTDGEFSFEERMGCGFGACMGCSCKTKNGFKRVCKDGPVFGKEEIVWED